MRLMGFIGNTLDFAKSDEWQLIVRMNLWEQSLEPVKKVPIISIGFWRDKCESGLANSIITVPQDSMKYARILCTAFPDAKFMLGTLFSRLQRAGFMVRWYLVLIFYTCFVWKWDILHPRITPIPTFPHRGGRRSDDWSVEYHFKL